MTKANDKWKKVSFGEFDAHANAYIAELVDELLREKDIEPGAFSFSLDVSYLDTDDSDGTQSQRDCAALHHDD
jgi:hypothetical protein